MEHGEIRELILAVREGSLELDWLIRLGSSWGDLRYNIAVLLRLRNTSRVPVIAPYVRLSDQSWHATSVEQLTTRVSATGTLGIYASRDVLVHVQDDIELAEISSGLDFRRTGQYELPVAIETVRKNGATSFAMAPYNDMSSEAGLTRDRMITAAGLFGAENVIAKEFYIEIRKLELLEKFCQLQGIKYR